jgi:hypothetical protein
MDILGTIHRKPSFKNGKWDYMHLEYDTIEEYCEATSKLMEILYKKNSEGKCFVKDGKGVRYDLDIIHANFKTEENRITILPVKCFEMQPTDSKKNKQQQKNKQE